MSENKTVSQNEILLGQALDRMPDSQRVLIVTEEGREIYKGFVANLMHSEIDRFQPIKEISLLADVFTKARLLERLPLAEKQPVPMDILSYFSFADLECVVYQKIITKNKPVANCEFTTGGPLRTQSKPLI